MLRHVSKRKMGSRFISIAAAAMAFIMLMTAYAVPAHAQSSTPRIIYEKCARHGPDSNRITWMKTKNCTSYRIRRVSDGKILKTTKKLTATIPRSSHEYIVTVDAYRGKKKISSSPIGIMLSPRIKKKGTAEGYIRKNLGKIKDLDLDGYNLYINHGQPEYLSEFIANIEPEGYYILGPSDAKQANTTIWCSDNNYIIKITHHKLKEIQEKTKETKEMIKKVHISGNTDFEKLNSIQKYLIYNVKYVYGDGHTDTVYSALKDKRANCVGFAKLFKCLCDREKIPCKVVYGITPGDYEAHAYNIAMLNNKWYVVDVCWDKYNFEKGSSQFKYFLVSDKEHDGIEPYYSPIKCEKSYNMLRV